MSTGSYSHIRRGYRPEDIVKIRAMRKAWPWRGLLGWGRKPAKSARVHRRHQPTIIDRYEHAKYRPEFVRTRAAVKSDNGGGCSSWMSLYRYWQRWSRERSASRKRRRGWA